MGRVTGTGAATGLLRMRTRCSECVRSWRVTLALPRGRTAHLAIIDTALPFANQHQSHALTQYSPPHPTPTIRPLWPRSRPVKDRR
jgi:hypothetical protein